MWAIGLKWACDFNNINNYDSETFYENTNFPERELSALVASKVCYQAVVYMYMYIIYMYIRTLSLSLSLSFPSQVHYHLGSFGDSLTFALSAGPKFDVNSTSEYTETILCEQLIK